MKAVTQNDVARELNLSQASVATVLGRSGKESNVRIGAATRSRIQATARRMGYVPNGIARNLRSGKTNTIILATLASIKYAYVQDQYEQIDLALARHGYHLDLELLSHAADPVSAFRAYIAGRCDGVIAGTIERFRDELQDLHRQGLPVVTCSIDPSAELDNVYFDFAEEAEIGMRHLLDQGCRDIASVINEHDDDDEAGRRRRLGYERAMAVAGIKVNDSYLIPWRVGNDPLTLWRKIAALRPRPTGLLVYNAELAAELSRTIRAAGVRVPEDLALVSCGDAEFNRFLDVPMTVVKTDYSAMAEAVVALLMAQLKNPRKLPQHIWVKPSLVARASSCRKLRT